VEAFDHPSAGLEPGIFDNQRFFFAARPYARRVTARLHLILFAPESGVQAQVLLSFPFRFHDAGIQGFGKKFAVMRVCPADDE
jgi:hypothetical protein